MTLFRKIDVNGAREHPLFAYLKVSGFHHDAMAPDKDIFSFSYRLKQKSCPTTRDFFAQFSKLDYSPMRNSDIRWNFEKFLINRKGKPVKRFDASSRVSDMREDIESLISPDV